MIEIDAIDPSQTSGVAQRFCKAPAETLVIDVEALKFFDWAYANGAKMAEDLVYIPMPDSVVVDIKERWGNEKSAECGTHSRGSRHGTVTPASVGAPAGLGFTAVSRCDNCLVPFRPGHL